MTTPLEAMPQLEKVIARSTKAGIPLPEEILTDWRMFNEEWLRIQRWLGPDWKKLAAELQAREL